MNRMAGAGPRGRIGALLAASLVAWAAALPAEEPATDPATTVIRTSPAPAPVARPTPAGQMQVRVYEGFSTLGPVHDAGRTPLAVDVAVGLATCPDGNTEISAMNIGGWHYDVTGTCGNAQNPGSVRVDGVTAAPVSATAANPGPQAPKTVMRCDPATWRCAPVAAP